jgi:hypothetical protein
VAAGIGMLLDPEAFAGIGAQFLQNPALLYLSAALGLLGGIALVLAHNVWIADWRVIITLIGWISIVDSTSWLVIPRAMTRLYSPLMVSTVLPLAGGVLAVLAGGVLCYFGYYARPARANANKRGKKT